MARFGRLAGSRSACLPAAPTLHGNKPYGHGRVCYLALGHDKVQTENPNFQKLVVNAVRWAKKPD